MRISSPNSISRIFAPGKIQKSYLLQVHFESLFRQFDSRAAFHYLRSFRRVRVDFDGHTAASKAKASVDGRRMGDNDVHCYLLQVNTNTVEPDNALDSVFRFSIHFFLLFSVFLAIYLRESLLLRLPNFQRRSLL